MGLEGRVAMITGAGGGIGAATALRLARDGATVAIVDLDEAGIGATAEAVRAAGGVALGVLGDVSQRASVDHVVARITEEYGRLDILVNNAGINRDAMATKMTEEQWDAVLDV